MGFPAFLGRVFFSAVFILAAWQKATDFGVDGGPALKAIEPKLDMIKSHVESLWGLEIPDFEVKYLLLAAITLEGLGGILFTLGSTFGAYFLLLFLAAVTPIMHDFYNYDPTSQEFTQEFIQFLKNLSLFGALLYYLGMRNSAAKQLARKRKGASKQKTT
eukprot:jgi/Mesen1/5736/ME000029S05044